MTSGINNRYCYQILTIARLLEVLTLEPVCLDLNISPIILPAIAS